MHKLLNNVRLTNPYACRATQEPSTERMFLNVDADNQYIAVFMSRSYIELTSSLEKLLIS
jgi:hypothetical protein